MHRNERLYDQILACWMGKNIGGTVGGPVEGKMEVLGFTGLPDIGADGPLPNDDLDLQLVNLHALEQRGAHIVTEDLSQEWEEHVHFPYDEYGYALMNIRRRLAAPLSGCYNNPFVDCMGSPIRSELWAALAPGDPRRAVYFACQDAMVDHAGGEGLYGEVFFAALESMAFDGGSREELIEKSLAYLPDGCMVSRAVNDTLKWYRQGVAYEQIRGMILGAYGSRNFTDAPQNIAFTMVGLLYGSDFADGMLKTINLGYDTDCTCATFGSIYGILYGTAGIPKDWAASVGEDIKLSPEITGIDYPRTISELTARTMEMKRRIDDEDPDCFTEQPETDCRRQIFHLPAGRGGYRNLKISIFVKDGSSVIAGRTKEITVSFFNRGFDVWRFQASVSGQAPLSGEQESVLAPGETLNLDFAVNAPASQVMTAQCCLCVKRLHDGMLWKEYAVPFALPLASRWEIDGEEAYLEGGFVTFPAGTHCMETTLDVPNERVIKLICATPNRVSLWVDGKIIHETPETGHYMPAFHRCPENQYTNLPLKAGKHRVTIHTESSDEGKFMFLPVSVKHEDANGSNFYFIDCPIGD